MRFQFDDNAFGTQNDKTVAAGNTLENSFSSAPNNPECQASIQTLTRQAPTVEALLTGFTNSTHVVRQSPELKQINAGIAQIQTEVETRISPFQSDFI